MMKLHKTYPIWLSLTALILAILACGPTPVQSVATQVPSAQPTPISQQPTPISQNPNPSNINQPSVTRAYLISATVQIYGLKTENGKLTPIYSGSGTILNSTGMILTNAHVAFPAAIGITGRDPDALAVALMDKEDQPPVFLYYAKVKAIDGYLDLAVIQITTTLDGASVDPSSLNLPFVQVGNSDDLHVGDHINVFGFPGIGGDTITFTDGSVSGFTPDTALGDRAWIKTNAGIAGGNSGGLAANDAGAIIGVPSLVGSGANVNTTDCRVIQDTNGDGVVDSKDTCIPTGEFINAIRPVNFALPLIKAVETGQTYVSTYPDVSAPAPTPVPTQPSPQPSPGGKESFSAITWMTAAADCTLQSQVTSYPSGTKAIVAAWSYAGMTDGESWSIEYKLEGTVIFTKQYSWSSGPEGTYSHCLTSDQGFPDGNYHVSLYVGSSNTLLTQADVVVGGGQPAPGPSDQGVVTLSGQVVDGDSMNPLPGAEIYVLNPGISFDQWKTDQGAMADVFSSAKADSQGNFSVPDKLALNVSYTVVFFVDGYKLKVFDNQTFDNKTPVNLQLLIKMTK